MSVLNVLELLPVALVIGVAVGVGVSRAQNAREQRTDRARRQAADQFARDIAASGTAAAHRRNVAATRAARHIETVDEWFARTGAEPTRKERA